MTLVLNQKINVVERNSAEVQRYFWNCEAYSGIISNDKFQVPLGQGSDSLQGADTASAQEKPGRQFDIAQNSLSEFTEWWINWTTGPIQHKISAKRGKNNEDYETKFLSSPPLLYIVIYKYFFLCYSITKQFWTNNLISLLMIILHFYMLRLKYLPRYFYQYQLISAKCCIKDYFI